jgi:hypothetical protein
VIASGPSLPGPKRLAECLATVLKCVQETALWALQRRLMHHTGRPGPIRQDQSDRTGPTEFNAADGGQMNRLKFIVPAVLLLGLTACQSTPAPSPVTNPGVRAGAAAQYPSAAGVKRLGETADLHGAGSTRYLRITAHAVVDPAVAVQPAVDPAAGRRRVGIEVEAVNVGGTAYRVTAGSFWLVDSAGVSHRPLRSGELTTGSPFVTETLGAGDTGLGWLVFEIPETAWPVSLHYRTTVNSRSRTVVWEM